MLKKNAFIFLINILGAAAVGVTSLASAQTLPLPKLQSLADEGANVTAAVVDLSNNRILAQIAPNRRVTPASVSKLFITAAALEQWGPDSVFTTRFSSTASVRNATLEGDLVFKGAGDPDMDTERLWMLITRLRQAGLSRVTGDLVINDALFGPVVCLIIDRCKARNASDNAYDSPLSAAGVNFSSVELSIIPAAQAGQPAQLQLLPPMLEGINIDGTITTVAGNKSALYSVRRDTELGEHTLRVSGQVPAGKGPFYVQRSVAYPSRYTGSILARMLADVGISIEGVVRVDSTPLPAGLNTLAQVDSPALAQQLRRMMTFSNNYMADTLTLDLLAYRDVPGPLTLPVASQFLETYARDINAASKTIDEQRVQDEQALILDSGSGLSVTNSLSAQDVIALLAHMYRQPSTFPAFLGSLPVPIHTPSRSLKRGNSQWLTRVAAKTGTLSQPVSVRAIAGYFRMQDGGWGAFAAMVNGSDKKRHVPFSTANSAIISDIEGVLEHY